MFSLIYTLHLRWAKLLQMLDRGNRTVGLMKSYKTNCIPKVTIIMIKYSHHSEILIRR